MPSIKKYSHTIDADGNKIIHFILHPVTTVQRTAIGLTLGIQDEGYTCFDTIQNLQYYWDGIVWITSISAILNTYNEIPIGIVDGINTIFTTVGGYTINTTKLYLNGLRLKLLDDYTESGPLQITFVDVPQIGDNILIDYS